MFIDRVSKAKIFVLQLLREISHENVVKLVNVHINHSDMSLYLAFDYAEHDLYVSCVFFFFFIYMLNVGSLHCYI